MTKRAEKRVVHPSATTHHPPGKAGGGMHMSLTGGASGNCFC